MTKTCSKFAQAIYIILHEKLQEEMEVFFTICCMTDGVNNTSLSFHRKGTAKRTCLTSFCHCEAPAGPWQSALPFHCKPGNVKRIRIATAPFGGFAMTNWDTDCIIPFGASQGHTRMRIASAPFGGFARTARKLSFPNEWEQIFPFWIHLLYEIVFPISMPIF